MGIFIAMVLTLIGFLMYVIMRALASAIPVTQYNYYNLYSSFIIIGIFVMWVIVYLIYGRK